MNKELKILLASPRVFCAGVDSAIEIVKKALKTEREVTGSIEKQLRELNESYRGTINELQKQIFTFKLSYWLGAYFSHISIKCSIKFYCSNIFI